MHQCLLPMLKKSQNYQRKPSKVYQVQHVAQSPQVEDSVPQRVCGHYTHCFNLPHFSFLPQLCLTPKNKGHRIIFLYSKSGYILHSPFSSWWKMAEKFTYGQIPNLIHFFLPGGKTLNARSFSKSSPNYTFGSEKDIKKKKSLFSCTLWTIMATTTLHTLYFEMWTFYKVEWQKTGGDDETLLEILNFTIAVASTETQTLATDPWLKQL